MIDEELLTQEDFRYIIARVVDNAKDAYNENDGSDFFKGKMLAYYEVLDTIRNELTVEGKDITRFGLDFSPEELLYPEGYRQLCGPT